MRSASGREHLDSFTFDCLGVYVVATLLSPPNRWSSASFLRWRQNVKAASMGEAALGAGFAKSDSGLSGGFAL